MKSPIESREPILSKTWESFGDLFINQGLFKKGIIVARSKKIGLEESSITEMSFRIGERELIFNCENGNLKKTQKLLLQIFPDAKTDIVILNSKRREEMFLPVILQDKQRDVGLYIYPWTKISLECEFSGFENFVTCGCLFGANLRAVDESDNTFPLIKHEKINFKRKIKEIVYKAEAANPYEETLFLELKKIALLINKLTKKDKIKHLTYHLPYYDYILFGISLFINANINLQQLKNFINLIFEKVLSYQERINSICRFYNINVLIISPFDNLFGPYRNHDDTIEEIFKILDLNLPRDKFGYVLITEEKKIKTMTDTIAVILNKLKTNNYNCDQKNIWTDFVKDDSKIANFENLFKIANAVILAIAAKNKKDNQTCSLLPLTEKQIQVQYAAYSSYPVIFNMTMLDPIIAYSFNNNGHLFYLNEGQDTLLNLIINEEILQRAYKKMRIFSEKKSSDMHGTQSILADDFFPKSISSP